MKFQKLTIHNIASIEDAVIDFEAQPLADSEVFLITGKTGAGKSTILDAICLALFADTPRLDSTKMQGDTKDGEKTVKIDDPRQLMRRNTGEAFVSLTFMGSNDVHYQATWSVARARKKVTGNMQSKDWQLKNLNTGLILTKDKEIEAELKAAIGLDFNQFCRTTMLAQGEFTRFLNSKDDEKAEILEKITGVDVYSKIGAKVFEVTGQKKQIWEDAQRLVEGTHTLTDAEITEKQEAWKVLDRQYKEMKAENDKDMAKLDWIRTDSELTKSKHAAAEALRTASEAIDSEDFQQKMQTVKDWNVTIDARLWMNEAQKAANTLHEQKSALDRLAGTYSELLGGKNYAENEVGKIDTALKEIETWITGESEKVGVYEHVQTIVGHLKAMDDGRKAIQNSQTTWDKENKKLTNELTPAYEKAKQEVLSAKNAFEKEESHVKTLEEAIVTLKLPELRDKREAAKELLGKIATAKERIESLASAQKQQEETRQMLAERKKVLDEKIVKCSAMDAPIHDAKIKMDIRKEDLDKQSDTIHKFASTLRFKLQIGDTCPVCLQTIHSALPHEEDLAALVGDLKKAYEEAAKEYTDLVESKVKLDAEIHTESNAYERDTQSFVEDKSVANAAQKAREACQACGIKEPSDLVEAFEESSIRTFNQLDSQVKDGEKQDWQVKELRRALETKRKGIESLADRVLEAEKAMNECRSKIATAEALIASKQRELELAKNSVAHLITIDNWKIDWHDSPMEFASALTYSAQKYNSRIQQKQLLASQLESSKNRVEHVQSVLSAILSMMPSWADVEPAEMVQIEHLLTRANTLNTSVATALSRLKTAEESMTANQTRLHDFLTEHTELNKERMVVLNGYTVQDMTRLDKAIQMAREAVVAKKTLFDNAERLIAEHRTKKPETTEDETLDILSVRIATTEKQLTEIGEQKGAINQELKTDQDNKARLSNLIEDAEKKKAVYQKWSRMNQLIGDATGNKFRKIAQSYVLSSLIHSANSYMRTLTDRYTLKVAPGTFVITLEDAYQGFASRAASTISGGESFLVSLSLALALSDIGQTLSVDTLFIDEGFGTLSGEPLQNAINTLRSLHTKAGRHVGIISHVEELQERIPVQIQVLQEGNNSSSRITIIP